MRLMSKKMIININIFLSVLMFTTVKNSYFTNQYPQKVEVERFRIEVFCRLLFLVLRAS